MARLKTTDIVTVVSKSHCPQCSGLWTWQLGRGVVGDRENWRCAVLAESGLDGYEVNIMTQDVKVMWCECVCMLFSFPCLSLSSPHSFLPDPHRAFHFFPTHISRHHEITTNIPTFPRQPFLILPAAPRPALHTPVTTSLRYYFNDQNWRTRTSNVSISSNNTQVTVDGMVRIGQEAFWSFPCFTW